MNSLNSKIDGILLNVRLTQSMIETISGEITTEIYEHVSLYTNSEKQLLIIQLGNHFSIYFIEYSFYSLENVISHLTEDIKLAIADLNEFRN